MRMPRPFGGWFEVLLPYITVAIASLVIHVMQLVAHDSAPALTLLLAVMLSSIYGGVKSGVVALVLTIPLNILFWTLPVYDRFSMVHMYRIGLSLLLGSGIIWIVNRAQRCPDNCEVVAELSRQLNSVKRSKK